MKLFQMLLSRRSFLQKYTSSPELTEEVLSLFCETLPLNLDEEGDRNAQLGWNIFNGREEPKIKL